MSKLPFFTLLSWSLLLPGLVGAFSAPISAGTRASVIGTSRIDTTTNFLALPSPFVTTRTSSSMTIQIQTVPALPGVTFQLGGQEIVSGQDGLASITVDTPGPYRLLVLADKYYHPSQRIEFGRWLTDTYQPYLDIQVPAKKVVQVGLNTYDLVGQSFAGPDGSAVDPQRIKEFSFRSTQGDLFTFPDGRPRWIPASRVARRVQGLEEVKLLYSVLSVTIDGTNAVNQSQQRFYASPNQIWPISLLLYSLHISAKDALFGFATGGSVNLQFPDGRIQNFPLDKTGMVDIPSLARGNYFMELTDVHGLGNRAPVALSRNQDVSTSVITYLDLGVLGMFGVLIMLGLLFYGRPWLVRPRQLKTAPSAKSEPLF